MKVKELIELLRTQDPEARVGVSLSSSSGWIQGVRGLCLAPDGTVTVDQEEESLEEAEVRLRRIA